MDETLGKGVLITFEGGEGAGKSTHIGYLARALREAGREVVTLREPGGTSVGEALRAIVLDPAHDEIDDRTELLLYETARAQIVAEVIVPALERGAIVLCDRFFDSTVAYQAFGRGLPLEFVEQANAFACRGIEPDRTILMTTGSDAAVGLFRATKDDGADRLEAAGEEFHARVNEGFLALAERFPQRIRIVRSSESKAETCAEVFQTVGDLFPDIELPPAEAVVAAALAEKEARAE